MHTTDLNDKLIEFLAKEVSNLNEIAIDFFLGELSVCNAIRKDTTAEYIEDVIREWKKYDIGSRNGNLSQRTVMARKLVKLSSMLSDKKESDIAGMGITSEEMNEIAYTFRRLARYLDIQGIFAVVLC